MPETRNLKTTRHPSTPSERASRIGSNVLAVAAALRHRLRARARTYGSWISIGHPDIASLFASASGHFVGVDLEHTVTDFSIVQAMIRACHEYGRACLPRIFPSHLEQLRRLLDAGADGVIVPQVSRREDIDQIVQGLRYPPEGQRGYGVAAAHRFGRAFEAYVREANRSLSLIIQVESAEAVRRIDELVSHPAIDGVMVGPYDLSGSLGMPGRLTHPRVLEACERVIQACATASVSCGFHLPHPQIEEMQERLAMGFTLLVLGSDVFNLYQRSVEIDAMIDACGGLHPVVRATRSKV